MKDRIKLLINKATAFYDKGDPSHDLAHINRVMANCEWLTHKHREPVDLEILLAAAILHDVVNLPKNHPDRLLASQLAAEKSSRLLSEVGFDEKSIDRISSVIVEHSYSLGKKPSSVESAILQDADKLDALGAVGIMRAVTTGCRMGCSYYDAADFFAEHRPLNDKKFTIDHFYTKLFLLPDLMNTDSARAEARARVSFMKTFIEQLKMESTGDTFHE